MLLVEPLFWLSATLLFVAYPGYPLLLVLLTPLARQPRFCSARLPSLTILIPARDEADRIAGKIANLAAQDYLRERLEVLVLDDGSRDETFQRASEMLAESGLCGRVVSSGENHGKAQALNSGMEQASGEIVAFSDADCHLRDDALRMLVQPFGDARVGCVAGRYVPIGLQGEHARSAGAYWRYEDFLRRRESGLGGILGASGALYAIRRACWEPLPPGLINDDFVVPMRLNLRGWRAVYEPRAVAEEFAEDRDGVVEFAQRTRIMAGNWEHLWLFARLMVRSGFRVGVVLRMFAHKFLRVFSPFLLLIFCVSNLVLVVNGNAETQSGEMHAFYCVFLALQAALYGAAFWGHVLVRRARQALPVLLGLPYYFVMLNGAALAGAWAFFTKGPRAVRWHSDGMTSCDGGKRPNHG